MATKLTILLVVLGRPYGRISGFVVPSTPASLGPFVATRSSHSTSTNACGPSSRRRRWCPQQHHMGGERKEVGGSVEEGGRHFKAWAFPRVGISLGLSAAGSDGDVVMGDGDGEIQKGGADAATTPLLDRILSRLTSAFPLFVLSSAILGLTNPSLLRWVNEGQLISAMLASVMLGTGMTLQKRDFEEVLRENKASVPSGVLCQFLIMPMTAFLVGRTMLLPSDPGLGKHLFLGLVLVGCSPGGTASNLVSLIAGADVALSVLLTACSTILASAATPLLVKLLVGSTVSVSGTALCAATARVVLLPVALGMALNAKAPGLCRAVSRFTPFASVLLVSLICGGVVAQNAAAVLDVGAATTGAGAPLVSIIVASVLALHSLGFLAGYLVPRLGLGFKERTARTISIETGMQNSALAVVLARSVGAHPLAGLPGALSATAHSCLGSILAAYWRFVDEKNGD